MLIRRVEVKGREREGADRLNAAHLRAKFAYAARCCPPVTMHCDTLVFYKGYVAPRGSAKVLQEVVKFS